MFQEIGCDTVCDTTTAIIGNTLCLIPIFQYSLSFVRVTHKTTVAWKIVHILHTTWNIETLQLRFKSSTFSLIVSVEAATGSSNFFAVRKHTFVDTLYARWLLLDWTFPIVFFD